MGMSIKQLRAFLAVAHTLNFAHASERLNMSQPALSLAIKGLEDSLGGALLLRTTRKVTLTQEGETLLGRFFGGSVGKFVNCLYDKNRLSAEDIRELKRFVEEFEEKPQ